MYLNQVFAALEGKNSGQLDWVEFSSSLNLKAKVARIRVSNVPAVAGVRTSQRDTYCPEL